MADYGRLRQTEMSTEPSSPTEYAPYGPAACVQPWGNGEAAEQVPKVVPAGPPSARDSNAPAPWWSADGDGIGESSASAVEGATFEQEQTITEALALAKCMISDGLGVVSGGPGSESDEALMDTHFHAHDVGTASVVAAKLIATAAALAGDVPIDVHGFPMPRMPGNKNVVGGAVPVSPIFGAGDIHLFPAFFQVGAAEQAEIVLHEATHKYIGTVDHAYFRKAGYDKLTVPEAQENADSYTELCSLEHGDEERREEEARDKDREATRTVDQELAERHIAELWASYERGNILLFEDDHTLPDGRVLPPDIVALAIIDWFERTKWNYVEEVYAAWEGGQESGPFWCSDSTVVRWDLYDALISRR